MLYTSVPLSQEIRLLAAILAKNAIAKFWPVTHTNPLLGTLLREEKMRSRNMILQVLQEEPDRGVAAQV